MNQIVILSILFSTLSATTIHVPSDYSTIQAGIDASADGDTVLVAQGTYSENLILANEIVLASHAIYDDLDSDWVNNENINNTIISGILTGSCLVIRDGNIEPTVIGFTFQDGTGTSMLITNDCAQKQERSGGAILIYKAYPTINYNRFMDNGFSGEEGQNTANGGAISHLSDEDIEFDEDRNNSSQSNNTNRDIPTTLNIQYNYFENNSSGDGENFYSNGYEGSIDVSNSVFENIDCESNSVNEFVLRSLENEADYVQNEISGSCIESNSFYVSIAGDDNNDGTETDPLKTIGHALTLVKDAETVTTINLSSGVYSPSTTGENFPIVVPNNVHLIGSEYTILDAEADANKEAAVMIIKEVENVRVANLTLTGGYSEGHGCTGGGGLLITANDMFNGDGTSSAWTGVVIEDVIIEDNWSHNGGGLSIYRSNGSVLNNVIIRDNACSAFGGGVFTYGSTVNMTNVTVTGNNNLAGTAQGGGMMMSITGGTLDNMTITDNEGCCGGGGVWTNGNNCTWVMTNSIISGNSSDWGGGLAVLGGDVTGAEPTLINVTISNNTASSNGGAVWTVDASPTFENCTFTGNTALADGMGGTFWLMGVGDPSLTDCLISENTAPYATAGIWSMSVTTLNLTRVTIADNSGEWNPGVFISDAYDDGSHTPATLTNCTITGNSSSNGSTIRATYGGHIDVINSIIWDNATPAEVSIASGSVDIIYSDIDGGWGGEGNITADPLFVDADNGDFTLQVESPCIDAGIADTDGDGVEDITDYFGDMPDMGVFEFLTAVSGLQYFIQDTYVILAWDPFADVQYYLLERSTDPLFTTDVVSNYLTQNTYTDEDQGFSYLSQVLDNKSDIILNIHNRRRRKRIKKIKNSKQN